MMLYMAGSEWGTTRIDLLRITDLLRKGVS